MSKIWIRADGGPGIGSGHLMRCLSVAKAAEALGTKTEFLVSGSKSSALIESSGAKVVQVGGDPFALGGEDAGRILELANPGDVVLVDSYAVSDGLFGAFAGGGVSVAYMDDRYLFSTGALDRPRRWDVDVVIDYGFSAEECGYGDVYAVTATRLLLGPRYAPVRREFREAAAHRRRDAGRRILVTSGSTNPDCSLERMVEGCLSACGLPLDVVVGAFSEFDGGEFPPDRVSVHRGVGDLAPLMARAALAVAAAGSTLYELSCVGVPTVACPIFENQSGNVAGFAKMGLGISLNPGWAAPDVRHAVHHMIAHGSLRHGFSDAMVGAVDGRGSERVARALLGLGGE